MKTLKPETLDLLIKLFITNGYRERGNNLLSLLSYLPELTQVHLNWLWEGKLYAVLNEYYLGYYTRDRRTYEEKEQFRQQIVKLYAELPKDATAKHYDSTLHTITEQYVREVKTPEQFEFLFNFKTIEVTKQLLANSECPKGILAACQDDVQYVKALLSNTKLPSEIALDLILRHKVPITDYKIANMMSLHSFTSKIVVDIRPATEEDIKNGLTLQQKINWWNNR
jgi:hypothetical protein